MSTVPTSIIVMFKQGTSIQHANELVRRLGCSVQQNLANLSRVTLFVNILPQAKDALMQEFMELAEVESVSDGDDGFVST